MPNIDNLNNENEDFQDKPKEIKETSIEDIQETTEKLSGLIIEKADIIKSEVRDDSESQEEIKIVLQDEEKFKKQIEERLNYENILKQPMPIPGTAEYRERQNFIAHDISRRAGDIKIDEFTYFEELEEYIDKNPLFKQEDKNFAYKALKRIKDVIPKIEKTAEKYIKEINTDTRTKNLFRSYLMINRLIGQKETSATNLLSNESFENVVMKSKNNSNVFDLDIFKNKDIQEYLKKDFNPEEYKKYYKEFTEQRLLTENKDNIKKYIKIQSIINSQKWQEMWSNVA